MPVGISPRLRLGSGTIRYSWALLMESIRSRSTRASRLGNARVDGKHPYAVAWYRGWPPPSSAVAAAELVPALCEHCRLASPLTADGLDVNIVQVRLRHASAKTTLDVYGHLWPDKDEATRATVSAAIASWIDSPAESLRNRS